MPRSPRVFVEGGIYHVYNRVTRGERVFSEDHEAARLLDAMRHARDRDGLVVLAWCIMGNHYHLALRCGPVPLWRSMASIHSRVSKSYNSRNRFYGPFWQGRYRAKLVETPEYLRQLILYVHLNPATAGIVAKPEDFLWSGHRELVRKVREPFVEPDQLLLAFDETRRSARKSYLASIRSGAGQPWMDGLPGDLPWWRPAGRTRPEDPDDELHTDPDAPHVDELARSAGRERPLLGAATFVRIILDTLEVSLDEVSGRGKRAEVVRAREILMTLGIERYGLRVTEMAAVLDVRYHSACLWSRRGASRKRDDPGFARTLDAVDTVVSATPPDTVELGT